MPVGHSQRSLRAANLESIRSKATISSQNEFIFKTNKQALSREAQRLVKASNFMNFNNLKQKRERLRELFSIEDRFYECALHHDVKMKVEEDFKARENRLLGLRSERETQRLKFAEQMRLQQIINSCDEIRPYLRQKLQDEYKSCQLLQIQDNNLKKLEQMDYDRVWDEVQKEALYEMTSRERDADLCARSRNLEIQKILKKQMAEKQEYDKKVGYEQETINCGEIVQEGTSQQDHPFQVKLRQRQFAQELLSQQEEKLKMKRDLKSREINHDLVLIRNDNEKVKFAEENLIKQKIQNMKETLQYLDYIKNTRKDKLLSDKDIEEATENVRYQKDCEYFTHRKQFSHDRNEFNKAIYEERWKQINDQREKLLRERSKKIKDNIEENKTFAESARIESISVAKRRNVRHQYGRELRAQWNYQKQLKNEADTAMDNLMKTFQNEERTKLELIKANLGRIHEKYPIHYNFKAILNSKN